MRQQDRAVLGGRVIRALAATWRLLTGDQRPALDKCSALVRASIATGSTSRQHPIAWRFADAVLVYRRWMCVLENNHEVYVVEVHCYTGHARVIARAVRRRPEPTAAPSRCRQTGRLARIRPAGDAARLRHRVAVPPR